MDSVILVGCGGLAELAVGLSISGVEVSGSTDRRRVWCVAVFCFPVSCLWCSGFVLIVLSCSSGEVEGELEAELDSE